MTKTQVRVATEEDAAAILDIYTPIVRDTAISFEVVPPTLEEMRSRIRETLTTYPWLVGEREGELVGYGYAGPLRPRPAYRWSVEASMYVRAGARVTGVGRTIGLELLDIFLTQGIVNVFGGVALPNPASEGVFRSMGFEKVGVFRAAGFKLGKWHDVAWYQRRLIHPPPSAPPFIPFSDLRR